MEYLTTKKIAAKWGISQRRVSVLCNQGRIEGAKKLDWIWMIPANAKKPQDKRQKKAIKQISDHLWQNVEKLIFDYEKSINEEIKKTNGIYYTDFKMVDLMFKDLKLNKSSIVMDPCCGAGSFLIGAKKNGYKEIYGLDNDAKALDICKQNIKEVKLFHFDTLSNNFDTIINKNNIKRPDLIIGNPPYAPITSNVILKSELEFMKKVKNSGNNLFIAALYRALEIVKDKGIVSYIIPKNFLHVKAYNLVRKEILNNYKIISIVDIGAYFKNVRGEQIILTIKKELPNNKHKIKFKKLIDNRFQVLTKVNQNYYKDEILIFESKEDINIYEKLSSLYRNLGDICTGYIGRGKSKDINAVSGRNLIKFGIKDLPISVPEKGNKIFIQNIYSAESGIIGSFAGNLNAKETVTVITDSNENICRYLLGILHSRLCNYYLIKYCFNNSKLTMHTDAKYIKKIPVIINKNSKEYLEMINLVKEIEKTEYLSAKWMELFERMNSLVYRIYKLEIEEIKFIERTMRRIQSKRWFANYER